MEKISPRVDIAFKKIFGVEENKDLLISLVNSIVQPEDQVTEVTLLNPYNPKSFQKDKLSILDIKATGQDGKRFNIEIQIADEADYNKRALYYWAKLYTEQLKTSEDYSKLSKAIGIHILNFTSIPDIDDYHNVFHITEKKRGFVYFGDLELHTIELKKFSNNSSEELAEMVARVKNSLDMWMAFLTRNDLLNRDNLPSSLDNPALKKALNVLDVMNFGSEERELYEDHLKWLRIQTNTLKNYETKGFERGFERGIESGLEQGIEQGIEKGIEKGIEQGLEKGSQVEKLNIARKMHEKGMDIALISEVTGLSPDKIKSVIF